MKLWRRPLDWETALVPPGRVHVIEERCKGCTLCVEYCPRDVLAMSSAFNRKGYHPPEVVEAELCVDCKLCEMICPEFAIYSTAGQDRGSEVAAEGGSSAAVAAAGSAP